MEREELEEKGVGSLDRLVAARRYAALPELRNAVYRLKYKRMRSLAPVLGSLLLDASRLIEGDRPVLCPVPLHWSRKFLRGFNQAELLACEVGAARGWPVACLLKRVRATGTQVKREHSERLHALDDAFMVMRGIAMPMHVILVDDISTSGATLAQCARALKQAGCMRVEALVLAQG